MVAVNFFTMVPYLPAILQDSPKDKIQKTHNIVAIDQYIKIPGLHLAKNETPAL